MSENEEKQQLSSTFGGLKQGGYRAAKWEGLFQASSLMEVKVLFSISHTHC